MYVVLSACVLDKLAEVSLYSNYCGSKLNRLISKLFYNPDSKRFSTSHMFKAEGYSC